MLDENERCRNAGVSSAYEVQRAKTLYRRIAKLIHPDVNPETDRQEVLKELWQRVLTAYGRNDVRALSELEVLARKALSELGAGEIQIEIPDLEERIGELKVEILKTKSTEPYTYKSLLEDPAEVERKRRELTEELSAWQKYTKELEEVIRQMLDSGEIQLKWQTN